MRLCQEFVSFKFCMAYTEEELQIRSQEKIQLPERTFSKTFGFVFCHRQLQAVVCSTGQCRAKNQNHELFPGFCLTWKNLERFTLNLSVNHKNFLVSFGC